MQNFKAFAVIFVFLMILGMALPAFAQVEDAEPSAEVTEEPEVGDIVIFVGTITITEDEEGEDGDLVFTTLDGHVFIIAPAGSFSPSILADYEEGALFEIEGLLLNEGDEDNPATIQVSIFAEYDIETDTDGDGIPDVEDLCPELASEDQTDTDGDGIADVCDEFPETADDLDNDGVSDAEDICPEIANPIDETTGEQAYPIDTDGDGIGDACEETEEEEPELNENGFYCRNRDVQHPNGGRIAEAYGVDYATLISDFCGDDGSRRGWGLIRNELRAEAGVSHGNANGNSNGNPNASSNSNRNNGNANGNSNGNNNGNGNGNGNSNGNRNGRN